MLKVLIADDEYLVRLGIKETINWDQLDLEIVAEASNAMEALDKYMQTKPDIIISDICMGNTSGLDFIKEIRNMNTDSEIIISTGYDEFNFAKTALENGVSSYLLKPIKPNELIDSLLKLKKKIEAKKFTKTTLNNYNETLPYLKEHFFHDLIAGKITNPGDIAEKCKLYNIKPLTPFYSIADIYIDNFEFVSDNMSSEKLELLSTLMHNSVEHISRLLTDTYMFSCQFKNGHYILIIYHDNLATINQHNAVRNILLKNIKDKFETSSLKTATIGVSNMQTDFNFFHEAYKQSKTALDYKAIIGNNSIIHFNDVPKTSATSLSLSTSDIEDIIQLIKKLDKEHLLKKLDEIFSYIKQNTHTSIQIVKSTVLELIIMVSRTILKSPDDMHKIFGNNLLPDVEITKLETTHDIVVWTKDFFMKILDHPIIFLKYSYKREVQDAISIIMRDYDKPITIEQVADELFISPSYLMYLFKHEVGKTFNEYLTEYRIELATNMLKTQKYKIYEVCDKVGYKNTKYFSQLFKKSTNYTPKEFSELNKKGKYN